MAGKKLRMGNNPLERIKSTVIEPKRETEIPEKREKKASNKTKPITLKNPTGREESNSTTTTSKTKITLNNHMKTEQQTHRDEKAITKIESNIDSISNNLNNHSNISNKININTNPKTNIKSNTHKTDTYLIPLSAKTKEALYQKIIDLHQWLQEEDPKHTIENIAFTLTAGRSHFYIRTAFIVKDRADLKKQIDTVVNGDGWGDLTVNDCRENPTSFDGSTKGLAETLPIKLEEIYSRGTNSLEGTNCFEILETMGDLYIKGFNFKWKTIFNHRKFRKISMPTYPFLRDRYWLPEKKLEINRREKEDLTGTSKLHPLIHSNTSNISEQKYTTIIKQENPYLKDHVVNDDIIMPAAVYLEMARAAGELATTGKVDLLKDIVWNIPLQIAEGHKTVDINLFPEAEDIEFEITSKDENDQRILHSYGRMSYVDERLESREYKENYSLIDIDTIVNRCNTTMEGDQCYSLFDEVGIQYGSSFRGIKELHSNDMEAIAKIEFPPEGKEDFNQMVLHPSIVDCTLQTVLGLMIKDEENSTSPYLPHSVGRIQILKPLEEVCYAYVSRENNRPMTANSINHINCKIINQVGEVLVTLEDFSLKAPQKTSGSKDQEALLLEIFQRLEAGEIDILEAEQLTGSVLK